MVLRIDSNEDKPIKRLYKKAMLELDDFFSIKWKENKPRLVLVKNRKAINEIIGWETPDWLVGWVENNNVFILDKKNYGKESCHKYSDEEYYRLIKHELAHSFFQILSDYKSEPDWLWEGTAIYLSDQDKMKKNPSKFKDFLKYYKKGPGVYNESGFVIRILVKKHGKRKLLKLIISLREINSKKAFNKKFKEIYGFELNYNNFNKLI